jgi:hypothetical protein
MYINMEWKRTLPEEKDFCKRVLVTCRDASINGRYFVIISYINEQGKFCDDLHYNILKESIVSWSELPHDVSFPPF